MSLKKQFIKNYLKITLVNNKPGILQIRVGVLPKIEEKYKVLESTIVQLMRILSGINTIKTEFETGDITFFYDTEVLTDKQLMMWINGVIDIAIDSIQLISKYGETNKEYVISQLKPLLEKKAKVILGK